MITKEKLCSLYKSLIAPIIILVGVCGFIMWVPKLYNYNSFLLILLALPFVHEVSKKGLENLTENKLIMFYFLLFGLSLLFYDSYSNTQIGSLFESRNYKEKYWVNLFPNKDNAKNYRVPADIIATYSIGDSDCENYFGLNESCEKSERIYLIEKAYFTNGGYITFENTEEAIPLQVNEKVPITDIDGTNWWIELTNKQVQSGKKLKEFNK